MKWLILAAGTVLLVLLFILGGCTGSSDSTSADTPQNQNQEQQETATTEEAADSCITCHSDKQELMQTASVVEEVKSEETTGEG